MTLIFILISVISVAIALPPVVPRIVIGSPVRTMPIRQPVAPVVPFRPLNNPAFANGGISIARVAQHAATPNHVVRALEMNRFQAGRPVGFGSHSVVNSPANRAAGLSFPIPNPNPVGASGVVLSRLGSASSVSSTSSASGTFMSTRFMREALGILGVLGVAGIAGGVAASKARKS